VEICEALTGQQAKRDPASEYVSELNNNNLFENSFYKITQIVIQFYHVVLINKHSKKDKGGAEQDDLFFALFHGVFTWYGRSLRASSTICKD
jgi:hypothetical protein